MDKKLRVCHHDYTYDEECNACLYRQLFGDSNELDDESLSDLRELLSLDDD